MNFDQEDRGGLDYKKEEKQENNMYSGFFFTLINFHNLNILLVYTIYTESFLNQELKKVLQSEIKKGSSIEDQQGSSIKN